jgi:SAM-dependent methyltransferase
MPTSHTDVEACLLEVALPASGAVVVEAGCGRTTRLSAWRERIETLIGVDVDAAAGAGNAALDRFIEADLCARLPLDDESCDLVYTNFAIEHLVRPYAAFAEWRRIVRPGGGVVFLTSNVASPFVAASRRLPRRAVVAVKRAGAGAAETDVIPTAYRANTPERLDDLLVCAGFARAELHEVGTLHRYAARLPLVPALVTALEGRLPSRRRATLVGWYRTR